MTEKSREMRSRKGLIGGNLGFWPRQFRALPAIFSSLAIILAPIWLQECLEFGRENFDLFWWAAVSGRPPSLEYSSSPAGAGS